MTQHKKYTLELSPEEWKKRLSPEQYRILRNKGTERPFSGEYDHFFEKGKYVCAGCGQVLFTSESKFDSGCGWPAFDREVEKGNVEYADDSSFGMRRVEIMCSNCGGHLGHVFDDGPTETGQRFCVNSASLQFRDDKES
ncbi:MAG: peptide-methionine (R)-S-oxide reductase MsrB [Chitinophagales bacterium]